MSYSAPWAASRPHTRIPRPQRLAWPLTLGLFGLFFYQTHPGPGSWNETSRLAAVESLVERGTLRINGSPFEPMTKDKIRVRARYFCDKPPLFQLVAAGPYALFRHALGLRLDPWSCPDRLRCVRRWLVALMSGLPAALLTALFYLAWLHGSSPLGALVAALLLCFGTMVWPYALVFTNHVAAALALFGCFLAGIAARRHRDAWRFALCGLLGGAAVGFDLMTAAPVAALALVATRGRPRPLLILLAGVALPLGATAIADYRMTRSVLPPYFAPRAYRYPGSPFPGTVGALRPPEFPLAYAFHGLVGERGLLAHAPVLLWAIVGLVRVLRQRRHALWPEAAAAAAGITVFALYIFTRTDVHGGKAYGERYFFSLLPLLGYFALFALPPTGRVLRELPALFLAALLSVVSAWQGSRQVWTVTPPVLYLDVSERVPFLTVCTSFRNPDEPCLRP